MSASEWFGQWEWAGQRVLEALGNGVWQGILAAGLIWAGFGLLPRLNAATRYAAAFVALILAGALPVLHLGLKLLPGQWRQAPESALAFSEVRATPSASLDSAAWNFELQPASAEALPSMAYDTPVLAALAAAPADPAALGEGAAQADAAPARRFWNLAALRKEWTLAVPALVTLAFLAIWLGVSSCRIGALALQCLALRGMKRRACAGAEPLLLEFDRLRADMKLTRPVRLGISEEAATPMAAGFFRPMILLPPGMAPLLNSASGRLRLEGVLRHELAHVARRDDWTNLLQQILHAVYFFHPGVCWLARRMTLEREIACDDHVLAAAALGRGASRREYALLLTDFARQMQGPEWAAAPGAWGSENQLKERVTMILNKNRNASPRLAGAKAGVLTMGAVLIALLAMQAGPRLALAEEGKTDIAVATSGEEPNVEAEIDVEIDAKPQIATRIERSEDGKSIAVATVRSGGSASASSSGSGSAGFGHGRAVIVSQHEESSAPRRKPGGRAEAHADHPVPHPAPAPQALPPHAANLPHPAQPPQPGQPPAPPRARSADRDLERRLERLERLVENLDRKEGRDVWKHDFKWELKEPNFKFDEGKFKEQMARVETELKHKFNPDAMKRLHEEAGRAAEKAHREAERIAREVERSVREVEKSAKVQQEMAIQQQKQGQEKGARAGEMRRKALEQRRQALEKELRAVEREMERAEEESEREREKRENKAENSGHNNDDGDGGDKPEIKLKKRAPDEEKSEEKIRS